MVQKWDARCKADVTLRHPNLYVFLARGVGGSEMIAGASWMLRWNRPADQTLCFIAAPGRVLSDCFGAAGTIGPCRSERYRRTYNRVRPHSSLGYRPPAPEALLLAEPVPVLAGLT